MCDTLNAQEAQSCKYCGYIFEDFSNTAINNPAPQPWQQPSSTNSPSPQIDTTPIQPAVSTGSPLFVASKSIASSLAPGIIYLVFVAIFSTASGFSIYSIGVIVIFILVATVPVLFTPRKYEFYDNSLHITKIIGGASDIPYSDLEIQDYPTRRRPRIVLSVVGQRRAIIIPGNPSSGGEDLNQFLHKKLKIYNPNPKSQQPVPSSDTATSDDEDTQGEMPPV